MMRYTGQIFPRVPPGAPLAYRLEQEVYALDGLGLDLTFGAGAGASGSTSDQLQACMMQSQMKDQEHGRNMMLAIVGTAAAVFLLMEVLK